ncbi:MAG: flagellar hook-basal body complex protein FliE [Clostridia bacterium]|nr:flagellar hook-basal body complex protein FliE [Clostridia bacterium]
MINTMMGTSINNIYNNNVNSILNNVQGLTNDKDEASAADLFRSAFESAANALRDVDQMQKASDKATVDFITGEDDNIHNVLLAQEKALIALQFTSEVTNKALEAYNEIMRMSI